jgi:hypothetical protein
MKEILHACQRGMQINALHHRTIFEKPKLRCFETPQGDVMQDRRMNSVSAGTAASAFTRLMEKLTGKPAAAEQPKPEDGTDFESKSIVDVTEALLRQLDK